VKPSKRRATRRRPAKRAARAADALGAGFAAIYDGTRLGIATLDDHGRFLRANGALQRLLGYTEAELRKLDFNDVTYPDDVPACVDLFRALQEEGLPQFELEKRYVRKDGSLVWAHVMVTAVRSGGRLAHTIGIAQDIGERKRAEEDHWRLLASLEDRVRARTAELEYQGALLRAEQEASPNGVLVVSEERRIVGYNKLFLEMWGIPPDVAASGSDERAVRSVLARLVDPEGFLARVEELYGRPEESSFDEILLKDGRVFERHSSPIVETDRSFRGRVWHFHDITRRVEAERATLRAAKELERSNADLEMFAYASAHDLSSPLRKIAAFADELRAPGSALDPRQSELVDRIAACARGMDGLVQDALVLSRVGQEVLPLVVVDLAKAAAEAISDLEVPLREAGAEVVVEALPSVRAHATLMRRLFLNLIGNAVKFRRDGTTPRIVVSAARVDGGGWELAVADNGIGFEPRYAEKVFKPFSRLNSPDDYAGNGLGLAICARIIDRYAGTIRAESAPGLGTTIRARLPAAMAAPARETVHG